jgi:hypothetical protein
VKIKSLMFFSVYSFYFFKNQLKYIIYVF